MQLIANNDLLNLNTWDAATAPNGPCGAAACFTQAQVTGCSSTARARFVIGQIIGASSYDIGHLAHIPVRARGFDAEHGSASVVLPMVGTTHARVKIEAVD
jgi:hypothetical protein